MTKSSLIHSLLCALIFAVWSSCVAADEASPGADYAESIEPLLMKFCFACHSGKLTEADIDLGQFRSLADAKRQPDVWIKVREMLDSEQMPPKDEPQLTDSERQLVRKWVRDYLAAEAKARAGDPGPVVLRRLSNAEYTYTIRDLTGVDSLDPAAEFPIDGAAGEGFTNTGSGLVMSPSLVQKYLDAGKQIAEHAALLPDGIRFSPHRSRRDLTDDLLAKIRSLYGQYTTAGEGTAVDLQGIKFETNQGGIIPITDYVKATIAVRDAVRAGKTIVVADIAAERGLSPVYLERLWQTFSNEEESPSFLLQRLRRQWMTAEQGDVSEMVALISKWQPLVWKFNVVGHVGREGAPTSWMGPLTPVADRQEFRLKLPKPADGQDISVYLSATDAGDGNQHDYVRWQNARLELAGQPAINLRDVQGLKKLQDQLRHELLANTTQYLKAAADITGDAVVEEVAKRHNVNPQLLDVWAKYLLPGVAGPVQVTEHFINKLPNATYDFIAGWGVPETPSVTANSSDQQVRIPGISKPHSLVVHPSPTLFVAIGWRSPIDGIIQVDASLSDAHPECGNGVEWLVQHRSGSAAKRLAEGDFATAGSATMPPQTIAVTKGELVSLIVGPRQGNHSCDLTAVEFTITETTGDKRIWNAAKDNSGNLLEGNPHADGFGNNDTWHFYSGPMDQLNADQSESTAAPPGSLLAKWIEDAANRETIAEQVRVLATGPAPEGDQQTTPDGLLYHQLHSLTIPLNDQLLAQIERDPRFGTHPMGHAIDAEQLVVKAPAAEEFHIPAEFAGRELVVTGTVDSEHGREGTTQLTAGTVPPNNDASTSVIVCAPGSEARKQTESAFADFRNLFPFAACYARIVPVDEVVTATLFHREDDLFKRLMLNEQQAAELDQLWAELFYISQEPLQLVVSLEQIREFSTQDRPDMVEPWDKMKPTVLARAAAFRKQLVESEPSHVNAALDLAAKAWRRPLTDAEQQGLLELYQQLRQKELPHDDAVRLLIARALTSPTFLYRHETAGPGSEAAAITDLELASRLSYFLWSSMPDEELQTAAEANRLTHSRKRDPSAAEDTVLQQAHRMLADLKTRRLAIHFACQWLHVRDFDQNDDKNESLYPEFATLRSDMYEETVQFFEDMFRNNGSILGLLNSDHTFLNERLAKHYGIDGVTGEAWQRVDNARLNKRGGILTMATVLASQSGASRTSPILRGNWVSETLLGERLPRPPANVPQLPENVPTGLTARQLIEQHSSDPACAKCHARIDPYGFALEQYDAIGRVRPVAVDTTTTLFNGPKIDGIDGLRDYLANQRRDDIVRQFCRKLLGYALGREIQLSDEPLLDDMLKTLKTHDYRFHIAVESIVTSKQFREIRGRNHHGKP